MCNQFRIPECLFRNLIYIPFFIILMLCIQSCEAPLKLDSVISQKEKSTQRSDRFQKITNNTEVTVVVGTYGIILVSDDMGVNWTRQQLAEQPSFIDITSCPDKSIAALAFEGTVWVSLDNGISWQVTDLSSSETPQAISCTADGILWVVGSFSTFSSSKDKGKSWQSTSLDEDMILSYIQFFDAQNGIATGEFGSLLKTIDGGLSWQLQNPMPNEFYPIAAVFEDMNHGWVAGLSGKVLMTTDGGQTWSTDQTITQVPLYGISKDDSNLYVVGALGTILTKSLAQSSDAQWVSLNHNKNIRSYLRDSLSINGQVIFVGGSGSLARVSISEGGQINE